MASPIRLANRFTRRWRTLNPKHKERVLDIILELPRLLGDPHRHTGFGLRRLHGSDFYEARIDLRWRLVLKATGTEVVLFDVLNHDEIRRLGR